MKPARGACAGGLIQLLWHFRFRKEKLGPGNQPVANSRWTVDLATLILSSTLGQLVLDACFSDRKEDIRASRSCNLVWRVNLGCKAGRAVKGQNGFMVLFLVWERYYSDQWANWLAFNLFSIIEISSRRRSLNFFKDRMCCESG